MVIEMNSKGAISSDGTSNSSSSSAKKNSKKPRCQFFLLVIWWFRLFGIICFNCVSDLFWLTINCHFDWICLEIDVIILFLQNFRLLYVKFQWFSHGFDLWVLLCWISIISNMGFMGFESIHCLHKIIAIRNNVWIWISNGEGFAGFRCSSSSIFFVYEL